MAKVRTKADIRREQARQLLFGDVPETEVWSQALKGWAWVPRTMPLILQAIRSMSKGTSAAETYFGLWCNSFSHAIVEMKDKATLIAAAGYSGSSHERTWKERVRKLADLGFIKVASGKHGDISSVLILNPHKVLRRLKTKRTAGLEEKLYNTIMEQIAEYGMLDFNESPKVVIAQPVRPPLPIVRPAPRTQQKSAKISRN